MKRRFYVKIELELHAITCPGVWLCPNGYLEATIKTLGYFFKTGAMEPKFPVLSHEQFVMEGYFRSIGCYSELERTLNNEHIEISLWQSGRRLAYFSGKLGQIMQPSIPRITCYHNVNVQILMIPSSSFPGIIAPKVELSVRAIIQDRNSQSSKMSSKIFHNSTAPISFVPGFSRPINIFPHPPDHEVIPEYRRQKSVCHTTKDFKCHRNRTNFVPDKFNDLISTIPEVCRVCKSCSEKSVVRSQFVEERTRLGSGLSCCERRSSSSSSNRSFYSGVENKACSSDQRFCVHTDFNVDLNYGDEVHSRECKICRNYNAVFKEFKY